MEVVTALFAGGRILRHAELPRFIPAEQIMSMPATQQHRWAEAEVRRLIDESPSSTPRLELVDGDLLVTPAPGRVHQRVVLELAKLLDAFVRDNSLGELCLSPSDVRLSPELIVQPDLFVVGAVNGRRPRASDPITELLLAIEVISPASARFDRVAKRRAYQAARVPEYWIADPDARVVERWRPGDTRPEVMDDVMTWRPALSELQLTIDVGALYASVIDADEN